MMLKTILVSIIATVALIGVAQGAVYYYGYDHSPNYYGSQVVVSYDPYDAYFYAGYSTYPYSTYPYYYPNYYYPAYNSYYNYPYYYDSYYPYGGVYCQTNCYWVGGYRHCGCW